MNIGIDVDGVCAPFDPSFSDLLVKVTGKNLFPHLPYTPPCWEWPSALGYTQADESKTWDYVAKSDLFWEQLGAYKHTRPLLAVLRAAARRGHSVRFITNRMGIDPKGQTERWLKRNGYADASVVISGDKGVSAKQYALDWYADDKVENCEATRDICHTVVVKQPWNREVPGCKRMSADDLIEVIDGL